MACTFDIQISSFKCYKTLVSKMALTYWIVNDITSTPQIICPQTDTVVKCSKRVPWSPVQMIENYLPLKFHKK